MTLHQITIDTDSPPLVDPGQAEVRLDLPGSMVTGKIPVPDGEKGIVTIRTGNATLTVALDRAGVETWIGQLQELCRTMAGPGSGLIVVRQGVVPSVPVPR